jgi:hypothetical protein
LAVLNVQAVGDSFEAHPGGMAFKSWCAEQLLRNKKVHMVRTEQSALEWVETAD